MIKLSHRDIVNKLSVLEYILGPREYHSLPSPNAGFGVTSIENLGRVKTPFQGI